MIEDTFSHSGVREADLILELNKERPDKIVILKARTNTGVQTLPISGSLGQALDIPVALWYQLWSVGIRTRKDNLRHIYL